MNQVAKDIDFGVLNGEILALKSRIKKLEQVELIRRRRRNSMV